MKSLTFRYVLFDETSKNPKLRVKMGIFTSRLNTLLYIIIHIVIMM